ncbi:MAG: chloride channel protein [Clostridia bacterium]|nr:chloride channel protein [Clostridia bacterium]
MKLKAKLNEYKNFIINLIVPAVVFGFVTGTLTSLVVAIYKLVAGYIIDFSATGYAFLREKPYMLILVLLVLFGISFLFGYIYKRVPNIKGGGIPTSVGILRGLITFKWLRTLIGVFFMSLFTFLVGVPLGNEGPSVQMGTSIGRGSVYLFAKKHKAWDRYTMTGGACAGFSVATGAPISGIMFAIEEAHQRISPTIMIVASSSVLFANIASEIFCPLFNVSKSLFDIGALPRLEIGQLWLPLIIGIIVGIFGVLILKYYKYLNKLFNGVLVKVPHQYKIFSILAITVIMGMISFSNVSTGHELIHTLFSGQIAIPMLILILLVRSTLTLAANTNGITGGMFLPSLALGTIVSSIVGKICITLGLNEGLYQIILVLGIVACLSGLMKSPLTAIVFAIEALSCYENIISVIIVSLFSYLVTELFGAKSINDSAMETRIEELNEGKEAKTIKARVTVMPGAFAVGKQIRDIFWPANLFVLSVTKAKTHSSEVDEHGGKDLKVGDELEIQYTTFNDTLTKKEIEAIVGKQIA